MDTELMDRFKSGG